MAATVWWTTRRSPAAGSCCSTTRRARRGWAGSLRVIAYIHADLDPDIAEDPLLGQVGWTWLTEALGHAPAATPSPAAR